MSECIQNVAYALRSMNFANQQWVEMLCDGDSQSGDEGYELFRKQPSSLTNISANNIVPAKFSKEIGFEFWSSRHFGVTPNFLHRFQTPIPRLRRYWSLPFAIYYFPRVMTHPCRNIPCLEDVPEIVLWLFRVDQVHNASLPSTRKCSDPTLSRMFSYQHARQLQ